MDAATTICPCTRPDVFSLTFDDFAESTGLDTTIHTDRVMAMYDRTGEPISYAKWAWLLQYQPSLKIVQHDHLDDEQLVSTVWLGHDHGFGQGPPVIFETMVFGVDGWEGYQDRYCTEAEALAGHVQVLAAVIAGEFPDD